MGALTWDRSFLNFLIIREGGVLQLVIGFFVFTYSCSSLDSAPALRFEAKTVLRFEAQKQLLYNQMPISASRSESGPSCSPYDSMYMSISLTR